jgi:predicted DNA-binding transcriptional regulator AlpA
VTDLARQLHALADQLEHLKPGEVIGTLEKLKFEVWTGANSAPVAPAAPSTALDIDEVYRRTDMSKPWLYREARAGRLPFARRLGRRIVFDEAGLTRWLERRRTR